MKRSSFNALLELYNATWNSCFYQSSGKINARDYLGVLEKAGVQNLRNLNQDSLMTTAVNDWKIDNGIEIVP